MDELIAKNVGSLTMQELERKLRANGLDESQVAQAMTGFAEAENGKLIVDFSKWKKQVVQ